MISKSLYSFFAFSGSRVPAFTDYHLTPTQGLSQCDGEHTSVRLKISVVMAVTVLKRSIKHISYLLTTQRPNHTHARHVHHVLTSSFNKAFRLFCYISCSVRDAWMISKESHMVYVCLHLLFLPAIFPVNCLYNIFTIFSILKQSLKSFFSTIN